MTNSKLEYKREDVVSAECKFITHLKEYTPEEVDRAQRQVRDGTYRKSKFQDHNPPEKARPDVHVVKEWLTFKDGSRKANLRIIKDYKKPFWITKLHNQKHKQKKESENLDNLNKFYATESGMGREAAMRLGSRYIGRTALRDVRDDPYIYGLDISAKAYIKKMYMDKFTDNTPYDVCVLDIEEDMIKRQVIVMTITMRDKSYSTILNTWVKGGDETVKKINQIYDKHVPKIPYVNAIKREYAFFDTEIEMVKALFVKLHSWEPDLVEVWNIGYDIPRIVKICEDNEVAPKDVFSDPFLPKEYRHFIYKEGQTHKLTEAGKFKPMDLHEQWHTVDTPASFFIVDGMSAYYYIRQGGKKVPTGYSLDSILNKELGKDLKKLKFEDGKAEKLIKLAWHNYMVKNLPLEYIVYNNYDTIAPLLLDDKTKDLQVTLPILSGYSAYDIFHSGPKKIVEGLHFFAMERGVVLGSKPNVTEDDKLLGLKDWIVLLPSYRVKQNGMQCVSESCDIVTSVRAHTLDADRLVA